ncbi:glycosyltransferase [candidate division CSSED10-310 bacterium]|uniref:Glycosyltransferase n=1 Tax=candidate division CSSED10-310 bacterium TaxID=2855610 RepID=A0ABV6YXX0_UNCC1
MTNPARRSDHQNVSFTVSVLIPFHKWDQEVNRCVQSCLRQSYPVTEIILLPDDPLEVEVAPCVEIVTGPVFPGQKRNRGLQACTASITACIDSDAVADQDWVCNAVQFFSDTSIAVVGGPNLPPSTATEFELAGWEVLSSPLLAGPLASRYRQVPAHDRLEVQSSNMFIRTDRIKARGGFREDLLTGEDTDLCFSFKEQGLRVFYSPDVVVKHRPRSLFGPHMKQMFQYARDQAQVLHHISFTKGLLWFTPGLFSLLIALLVCLLFFGITSPLLFCSILYFFWTMIGAIWHGNMRRFPLRWFGAMATHFSYGLGFWFGVWTRLNKKTDSGASH